MFIIKRKIIYIVIITLIVLITIFKISKIKQKKVVETVALPVNKKVIILDAGHGRRRPVELRLKTEFQKLQLI